MFWGAMKIVAIPIPLNTMLTPEDYEYYLQQKMTSIFGSVALAPQEI